MLCSSASRGGYSGGRQDPEMGKENSSETADWMISYEERLKSLNHSLTQIKGIFFYLMWLAMKFWDFLPQKVSGRWCLQVQREIKLSDSRSTSKGQRKLFPNIPNTSILCPGGEWEKETTESGQTHSLSLNSVTYLLPLSEMQYWARWTAGLIQYVS